MHYRRDNAWLPIHAYYYKGKNYDLLVHVYLLDGMYGRFSDLPGLHVGRSCSQTVRKEVQMGQGTSLEFGSTGIGTGEYWELQQYAYGPGII